MNSGKKSGREDEQVGSSKKHEKKSSREVIYSPVGFRASTASSAVMRFGVKSSGVACMLSHIAELYVYAITALVAVDIVPRGGGVEEQAGR